MTKNAFVHLFADKTQEMSLITIHKTRKIYIRYETKPQDKKRRKLRCVKLIESYFYLLRKEIELNKYWEIVRGFVFFVFCC